MTVKPIIAGTDGSEESLRAVEWAAREAVLRKVALRIVSVPFLPPRMSPDEAGRETVAGIITQAARDALAIGAKRATDLEPGLAVDTELVQSGSPARVLTSESARADLVVLGRRRDGSAVGSVTHAVLSHAHGPVTTVPSG